MPMAAGTLGKCTVCGKPSWSAHSNKCEEHRAKPPTPRRVGGSAKPTAAAQIVGALPAIDAKTFSGKAPTATEWQEKLSATVVLLTLMYVEYAVINPSGIQEPYASNMMNELAMSDGEAETITEPFAHLVAGLEVNKKHGREAIEFLAFAPAILAVVEWHHRVSAFKREYAATGETQTQVIPETQPLRREVPPDVSSERPQAPTPAERPAVANFGGPGVWDPDQAPTSREHPNGSDLDDPVGALEKAHLAIYGAPNNEDDWARGG